MAAVIELSRCFFLVVLKSAVRPDNNVNGLDDQHLTVDKGHRLLDGRPVYKPALAAASAVGSSCSVSSLVSSFLWRKAPQRAAPKAPA